MRYRVGQKVRLLHESGTGVITNLIDRHHVEVDMGDDFPIDVHIDEIIPVDSGENTFLGASEEIEERISERLGTTIKQLGTSILDLSLVVLPKGDRTYTLHLANPEPVELLFTCFIKKGKKYEGIASGVLNSGEHFKLMQLDIDELNKLKSFYVQVLQFLPGAGFPHTPLQRELDWNKGRIQSPPKFLKLFNAEGWPFSLREDKQSTDIQSIKESEFVRIKKVEEAKPREEGEVDLHIEELVKKPHLMKASEMLKVQLEHFRKMLDKAIMDNYASLVVIHGVGEGTLRKEVHKVLKTIKQVKSVEKGDLNKYGNGATKIIFH
ncbi:MAG: Smr/MutS family protein [Bacteroidota bacterium]